MNNLEPVAPRNEDDDPPAKGVNLTLIYSLLALAFVAAIGVAVMIVMPFYHRR